MNVNEVEITHFIELALAWHSMGYLGLANGNKPMNADSLCVCMRIFG